jgi:hypothetical protein
MAFSSGVFALPQLKLAAFAAPAAVAATRNSATRNAE